MGNVASWFSEQRRVYFDNATTAREFRTQLRGLKAPVFLTLYLGLLVFIATVFYWGSSSFGSTSLAGIQQQLKGFYAVTVGMLEFLVGLVAPVLAATSIIGEYQRQSIDLLFTSPMSPKYFLVGKLVASYRYVLLLLVLSLPVAAMCVVLGGSTWKDVLSTYLLVSFHGLVYMSFSVPIAVMTAQPVTTVVWSYLAGLAYFVTLAVTGLTGAFRGSFGGPAPAYFGLVPAITAMAGGMTTEVFGIQLPMWVPAAVATLFIVRLMVLGGGSALTQAGSKEALNLRLTGAVMCLLLPWVATSSTSLPLGSGGSGLAGTVYLWSLPLLIVLPYLSTWAAAGGAKSWPNGWWRPKFTLRGTPASGLPYLMLLVAMISIGASVGLAPSGTIVAESFLYLSGVFGLWALAWSLGWAASALSWRSGIGSCRRLHVLFLFLVFVVPKIILGVLESTAAVQNWGLPVGWTRKLDLLDFIGDPMDVAWYKLALLPLFVFAVWAYAESKRRNAVESMRSAA